MLAANLTHLKRKILKHLVKKLLFIPLSLTLVQGCTRSFDGGWNPPLLYKIDIQQGNVIEQDMIDKLRVGMDKEQVRFIMGTPAIIDTFHSNRWDYIFSYQKGGKAREQRRITLHFEEEKLARISGDVETSYTRREEDLAREEKSVVVPEKAIKEKGFFGKILDTITPWGDE